MLTFIIRRLVVSIPIIFLVITTVFFTFQLLPGDPVRMYLGADAPQEAVDRKRAELGLDRPIMVQYVDYLAGLARLDLGDSLFSSRSVASEISRRFWNTVQLSLAAIAVATVSGVTLGTFAAIKRGTFWDGAVSIVSIAGISIPVFWLGLLLTYLLSVQLDLLPSSGNRSWRHFIMPTITLATFSLAFITRMTRSSVLETIGQDYVRTARAKGLGERLVVARHALRNALLPIATVVGLRFGYMLGGSVIVEEIFAWPGMGRLFVSAVGQRDIPVVQGTLLVFALTFVLVNLLVDITYAFIDPRIRHQ
jgi:ABC-type dipeptide/oligopeptide/nickel transport system permease component